MGIFVFTEWSVAPLGTEDQCASRCCRKRQRWFELYMREKCKCRIVALSGRAQDSNTSHCTEITWRYPIFREITRMCPQVVLGVLPLFERQGTRLKSPLTLAVRLFVQKKNWLCNSIGVLCE